MSRSVKILIGIVAVLVLVFLSCCDQARQASLGLVAVWQIGCRGRVR